MAIDTVGQYFSDWLGSLGMSQLEAATVSWYRSAATRHIVPALGSVKLAKLSPVMIESFLADKAESGRLDGNGSLPFGNNLLMVQISHCPLPTAHCPLLLRQHLGAYFFEKADAEKGDETLDYHYRDMSRDRDRGDFKKVFIT